MDTNKRIKKMKRIETEQTMKLKDVPNGEFVKLFRAGKPTAKTYQKIEYDRYEKAYRIDDEDDISVCRYVKGDKLVLVGFTY